MKKLFLTLPLIIMFVLIQSFFIEAHAENKKEVKYDIKLESLSESDDAKEFNSYKKNFLNYLNKQTKWTIEASGNNTFDYLTSKDLDFTDNTKIKGIKVHGSYKSREPYPKYEQVMSCLEKEKFWWSVVIEKDDTIYTFSISKQDNAGSSYHTHIGGDWYASGCYLKKNEEINYSAWYHSPEIVLSNLENLLKNCGESEKNIKFVYACIGDKWNNAYGIVFVNDTAKYIYSYGMAFPAISSDFHEDTPQVVINVFNEISSNICNNSKAHTFEIDNLYSYKTIMYLYELCEYYKKQ